MTSFAPASSSFNSRLSLILNASTDAVVLINDKGIVLSVNAMTTRMFGHEADVLVGCNVSKLMPEPHHSAHDEYIKRYLQTSVAKVMGACV
jgi:two-component system sensor histidine kinase/response regulator